ncbi:interleukin-1 receptor type 2-like isoform X1 [Arapaima gigas]
MDRALGYTGRGVGALLKGGTVVLVGSMCLLMAEALPAVTSPRIKRPCQPTIKATLGKRLVIPCKADPGFPDEFTLIYWLANKQFIEVMYPDNRVKEVDKKKKANNVVIKRSLKFETVNEEDFHTNYTCVVMSPAGMDKFTIRLNGEQENEEVRRKKPSTTTTSPVPAIKNFHPT